MSDGRNQELSNFFVYNFVCRFGDAAVLADLAEEIVLPAFMDSTLRRGYDQTEYFLNGVSLEVVGDYHCVYGRFIKKTVLVSTQIYDEEKGLVESNVEMPTARSSIFVLVLDNHQLLLAPETPEAPMDVSFRSTIQKFLIIKYFEYIRFVAEQNRRTKVSLRRELPRPILRISPIANRDGIIDYISRFEKITEVQMLVNDTNNTTHHDDFYEKLYEKKKRTGSSIALAQYVNPDGLKKDEMIKEIELVTEDANTDILFKGTNFNGESVFGRNNDIRARLAANIPDTNLADASSSLVDAWKQAQVDKVIAPAENEGNRDALEKFKRIFRN